MRKLWTLAAALLVLAACEFTPPSGQSVTFLDEFTGSSINLDYWNLGWFGDDVHPTGPANGGEDACWDPGQLSVSNSKLHLRLDDDNCLGRGWTGAGLSTQDSFATSSAVVHAEAKIKLPGRFGVFVDWPAFWLDGLSGCWPQFGELDIAEGLGLNNLRSVTHYGVSPYGCDDGGQQQQAVATSNDGAFHVYSADTRAVAGSCPTNWTNIEVKYRRDGTLTGTHTHCMDIRQGFFVILDLTCNPNGASCVDSDDGGWAIMDVEYVGISEG